MTTTTRQEEQQALLAAAETPDTPGVREVLEVYGPIAAYTGMRVVQPQPMMTYSTGGNA